MQRVGSGSYHVLGHHRNKWNAVCAVLSTGINGVWREWKKLLLNIIWNCTVEQIILLLSTVSLKGFMPSLLIHSYKNSLKHTHTHTFVVEYNILLCCFYRHTEQETEIIRDSTSKEQFSTSPLQFKFTFFNAHWKGFEFLVPVLQTISSSSSLTTLKDRLFTSNVCTHISKTLHQEWRHYLACASQIRKLAKC